MLKLSDTKILLCFLLGFVVCSFALAYASKQALDPDNGKNWWVVSFVDPTGANLDFTLENHSDTAHFTYTITRDRTLTDATVLDIPNGQSRTIHVEPSTGAEKVIIDIQGSNKDKKELYKNL